MNKLLLSFAFLCALPQTVLGNLYVQSHATYATQNTEIAAAVAACMTMAIFGNHNSSINRMKTEVLVAARKERWRRWNAQVDEEQLKNHVRGNYGTWYQEENEPPDLEAAREAKRRVDGRQNNWNRFDDEARRRGVQNRVHNYNYGAAYREHYDPNFDDIERAAQAEQAAQARRDRWADFDAEARRRGVEEEIRNNYRCDNWWRDHGEPDYNQLNAAEEQARQRRAREDAAQQQRQREQARASAWQRYYEEARRQGVENDVPHSAHYRQYYDPNFDEINEAAERKRQREQQQKKGKKHWWNFGKDDDSDADSDNGHHKSPPSEPEKPKVPTHYETLGVSKTATLDDIKKAFRTLAKTHHPDKNGNSPESIEKFKDLQNAYEILSDSDKKMRYDLGL